MAAVAVESDVVVTAPVSSVRPRGPVCGTDVHAPTQAVHRDVVDAEIPFAERLVLIDVVFESRRLDVLREACDGHVISGDQSAQLWLIFPTTLDLPFEALSFTASIKDNKQLTCTVTHM